MSDIFFEGHFKLDKPLSHWQIYYLEQFSKTRHLALDSTKLPNDHWLLKQMKLPKGIQGEYFLAIREPTFDCTIKKYRIFVPRFQKVIVTLFCIQKYHYSYLDKNIFVLIANYLIRESFFTYTDDNVNNDIMKSYPAFLCCFKYDIDHLLEFAFKGINRDDNDESPETQPSNWCQWKIDGTGTKIEHNQHQRFYKNFEWLEYLIEHFFDRWGYTLNGTVKYQLIAPQNFGNIIVTNNRIKIESTFTGD
jgi:hypothetical protein